MEGRLRIIHFGFWFALVAVLAACGTSESISGVGTSGLSQANSDSGGSGNEQGGDKDKDKDDDEDDEREWDVPRDCRGSLLEKVAESVTIRVGKLRFFHEANAEEAVLGSKAFSAFSFSAQFNEVVKQQEMNLPEINRTEILVDEVSIMFKKELWWLGEARFRPTRLASGRFQIKSKQPVKIENKKMVGRLEFDLCRNFQLSAGFFNPFLLRNIVVTPTVRAVYIP
jgi:hypothetical protein